MSLASFVIAHSVGALRGGNSHIALIAKDSRNLIQPGCSLRLQQVCDRGTALAAVSAFEHVIYRFYEYIALETGENTRTILSRMYSGRARRITDFLNWA